MNLLAALLSTALLTSACAAECRNDSVAEVRSPDGRRAAVLFQRDCGATTGFSTQISIVAAGQVPRAAGNVFVSDGDHGAAAAAPWGGPWAEASWLEDGRLLVRYDARARTFTRESKVDGVDIVYEPCPARAQCQPLRQSCWTCSSAARVSSGGPRSKALSTGRPASSRADKVTRPWVCSDSAKRRA